VRVLIIPSNALQCADDPRLIIHAEGNAVAVAEFKLRQIAVQMLFGAMLIHAFRAALKDQVVALQPCWYGYRRARIRRRNA